MTLNNEDKEHAIKLLREVEHWISEALTSVSPDGKMSFNGSDDDIDLLNDIQGLRMLLQGYTYQSDIETIDQTNKGIKK